MEEIEISQKYFDNTKKLKKLNPAQDNSGPNSHSSHEGLKFKIFYELDWSFFLFFDHL